MGARGEWVALLVGGALWAGCFPPREAPSCVTACGMRLYGSEACAELQSSEEGVRQSFPSHVPSWDDAHICDALSRLSVYVRQHDPEECWTERGVKVCGLAHCELGFVILGKERLALAHEVAHVLEGCEDPEHRTWSARGVFRAIDEANNRGAAPKEVLIE